MANGDAFSGTQKRWEKDGLSGRIFIVCTLLGIVFHFNVNRILEEVPQR